MNPNLDAELTDDFSTDWMTWFVVRHFLPASAQRVLTRRAVEEMSAGELRLEHLIEEVSLGASTWNDSWFFRTKPVDDRLASYAERVVSAIAWQNDDDGGWMATQQSDSTTAAIGPPFVDLLLRTSVADFGWPTSAFHEFSRFDAVLQDGLRRFLKAFAVARVPSAAEGTGLWSRVHEELGDLPRPLKFLVTKHLADLCADSDRWSDANAGYGLAESVLADWTPPSTFWTELREMWRTMTKQSQAGAERILNGAKSSAPLFAELTSPTLAEAPFTALNASFDAFVTSSHASVDGFSARDSRVRVMDAPLLLKSHTAEQAMRHWLNRKHRDAARHWWSLLRRQIALGGEYEARITKGLYARTLLEDLRSVLAKEVRHDSFAMAVRMMIESGRHDAAEALEWSPELVDTYVTEAVIDEVLVRVDAFDGTRIERQICALALFKPWVENLSPGSRTLGERLWRAIAKLAAEGPVELSSSRDVARPAFKALSDLARRRPEWAHGVAADVASAVLRKLEPSEETWLANEAALSAAHQYIDAFLPNDVRLVIDAALRLLDEVDPAVGLFPVVRPALALLVTKTVKTHAHNDAKVREKVLSTILRFGGAQESEMTRVVFYLHDFDRELLTDPLVRSKLGPAVDETRKSALQISSSNVSDSIEALLIAPALSGRDGLLDALEGLQRVIASARSKRASLGLAFAYDPILDLCSYAEDIRREIGDETEWRRRLDGLATALADLWEAACTHPVLLAPFSLPPPTRPEPTIVHNWAFATQRFASAFGYAPRLGGLLAGAEKVAELAESVRLARATEAISSGVAPAPPRSAVDDARAENRDGFYNALGRWLVLLQDLPDNEGNELADALFLQVLRYGPRPIDAAVLLEAKRRGCRDHTWRARLDEYAQRLRAEPNLSLVLNPIVRWFQEKNAES